MFSRRKVLDRGYVGTVLLQLSNDHIDVDEAVVHDAGVATIQVVVQRTVDWGAVDIFSLGLPSQDQGVQPQFCCHVRSPP